MNSVELLDKKAQLKEQAYNMIDVAKQEIRSFSETEKEAYESIKNEIEQINEELRALEVALAPEIINDLNKQTKPIMEKNFSLLKAVRSCANNQSLDNVSMAVVEAGAEEMRKAGLNFSGQIQLPSPEFRAVTVAAEGEDVVATDLMDIAKPLQARNVMVQAGAKYLSGLTGDVQYPVMSSANCGWEGEIEEAEEGAITFSNVKLTPHRLTAVVPISKQFLAQDSVGAENAIREEIINAINAKLEATILGAGAGDANTPAGMFNGELDAVSDFAALCDMEADIEDANVYGELKYILSPKAKSALRNMAKSAKSTQLVYENGDVDGTPALSTSHVKDTNFAYGDFSQYLIASWGALDIVVDNYTLASKGQVRLVVTAFFDAKALRPEAIKVGKIVVA